MMGYDREIRYLQNQMEILKHNGLCLGDYDRTKCYDCEVEFECMKLFIKERAKVEKRTIAKMKEVQDGKS